MLIVDQYNDDVCINWVTKPFQMGREESLLILQFVCGLVHRGIPGVRKMYI